MTVEEKVTDLARRQHGVVARGQLMRLGVSSSAIGRRLGSGRLRPVHEGVYLHDALEDDRSAEMAAVLAGGATAALSHTSSLWLWGLLGEDPPRPVHVTVPRKGRGRRTGIVFHRTGALDEDERTVVDGIPVTTPVRAIVEAAGMLGRRELEQAFATAEREGLIQREEMEGVTERYAGRPGMPALRALLDEPAGAQFTRSEAERRCLDLLRAARLPGPHANVAVGPYELDLFWPEENLAIEIDGHRHHSSRRRFEGDRRKDNWLRAQGIEVIRLTWRQITRERLATAALIGQALAWARAKSPERGERGPEPRKRGPGPGKMW